MYVAGMTIILPSWSMTGGVSQIKNCSVVINYHNVVYNNKLYSNLQTVALQSLQDKKLLFIN